MDDKKNILVVVLIALLFAKFAFFPVIEFQETMRKEVLQLSGKHARLSSIAENETVLRSEFEKVKSEELSLSGFVPESSADSFRLDLQQQFEKMFATNNVEMQVFDWLTVSPVPDSSIKKVLINIRINGLVSGIVMSHASIDEMQNIQIEDMDVSWFSALDKKTVLSVQMNLAVYYEEKKVDE